MRLTSSTPDALWNTPAARLLRPAAVTCTDPTRGTLLDRCSLSVPVGRRLLVVRGPAALLAAAVTAVIGIVAALGDDPLGIGPAAGFLLLPRVPSSAVEGDALRMAGVGLLLAAALLGVVRAVLERAEL